jgi:ribosomal protein S6--L-glutamate ligase
VDLAVLTARPDVGSVTRLFEAAKQHGVGLRVVEALTSVATVEAGVGPGVVAGSGQSDPLPSCVLARIGNWRPESLLSLLEAFEDVGVPAPNPAASIRCGRDHWATMRAVSAAGLAIPRTLVGADPETLGNVASEALRFPVVVKARRSRMGVGVIRCLERDHLESVLDSLWRLGEEMVVQEFVGAPGRSVRALVVDTQVVAAAAFVATADEWRSNGARGAAAEVVAIDRDLRFAAEGAAAATGLAIAGVDLLDGADGPVVCEVNPTPGFVRLERATSVDVAGHIIEALVRWSVR